MTQIIYESEPSGFYLILGYVDNFSFQHSPKPSS